MSDVRYLELLILSIFVQFLESIHDLVICRLSRQSGYATGGDEVFLLCEKINKGIYDIF